MTESSTKSTSFASMKRQYKELARKFLTQANEQDLKNLIILMANQDNMKLPKQITDICRIFTVAAVAERLDHLQKGKPNVPNRRTRPSADNASDGTTPVLREDTSESA